MLPLIKNVKYFILNQEPQDYHLIFSYLIPASRNFHEPPEKLKLINRAEFFQLGRFSLFSLVLPVTFRAASYANLAAHLRKIPLHIRADKHARELLSTSTTAGGRRQRQQSFRFIATHSPKHSFPQETKFSLAALK